MHKWLDLDWYRYLWQRRLPPEARALAVLLLVLLVLGGGYLAANNLASASGGTSSSSDAYILRTSTRTRVVTVKTKNRTPIVKRYPVVKTVRIKAKALTIRDLRTVTTPQGVRTVPLVKVRYVPVTRTDTRVVGHVVTDLVTRGGKTKTVVTDRPVTVSQTVPVTVSRTETQVVTNEHTDTVTATVVSPPETTTVTATETHTLPQVTTTVVVTQTVTVLGLPGR